MLQLTASISRPALHPNFRGGQVIVCISDPQLSLSMKSTAYPYLHKEVKLVSAITLSALTKLFPCADEAKLEKNVVFQFTESREKQI